MKAPEIIYHVSYTQLSIARYYGGCTFNGHYYVYNKDDDTLTRDDILRAETKHKNQQIKKKKQAALNAMSDLFKG